MTEVIFSYEMYSNNLFLFITSINAFYSVEICTPKVNKEQGFPFKETASVTSYCTPNDIIFIIYRII